MSAGEPDQIALAVLDDGHPFLPARLTEHALVINMDPVRFSLDRDARLAQPAGAAPGVIEPQVDQRAGCRLLEHQAGRAESQEGESWRVIPGDELTVELAGIEGNCPVDVVSVLRDLMEFHDAPVRYLHSMPTHI